VTPGNYSIEIGKANVEINIPDISISETHGFLKHDTEINEIVYEDNQSRYGTSLLIQRLV